MDGLLLAQFSVAADNSSHLSNFSRGSRGSHPNQNLTIVAELQVIVFAQAVSEPRPASPFLLNVDGSIRTRSGSRFGDC